MVKLSDRSIATIVLLVIAAFVVIVAGLSILSNNPVLVSIVGVIVGATFLLIGNIVNVTWLDPLKRKQDREERQREWERELSYKNANLRRALYSEIINLASNVGGRIAPIKDMCASGETDSFKNPDRGKVAAPLSFRVYESLKTDPLAFYQLEEASNIDFAYNRLRTVDNVLQEFEKSSIDSEKEAKTKCAALIGLHKISLLAIDEVFNYDKHYNKHILQDLDDGLFAKKWGALKKVQESVFGPLDRDP